MLRASLHTQYELSVEVVLQVIMVALLWFGTSRSVPKTVARLAGEQGDDLELRNFRFVVHMRDSRWVFGSLLALAACDGWLTFAGSGVGGVLLWVVSAMVGIFGAVVGLEGLPSWGVPTTFRGGARLLANAKSVRVSWYGRGSFSPVVWIGAVMVAYCCSFVCMFVLAPRMDAVLGVLIGADVPFWVLFWCFLPIAPTLRSVNGHEGAGGIWPDWVSRSMPSRSKDSSP